MSFDREKFNKLVSPKKSNWVKKAKWRRRNDWWLKYWQRIQVKYYINKRKIKNKMPSWCNW